MKKEHILLLLTLIFSIVHVNAQPGFEWAKSMGGSVDFKSVYVSNYGPSLAIDDSGYVYNIGFFDGTADFDPGDETNNHSSNGSYDIFIQKLDSAGNLIWIRAIGGPSDDRGMSIALDDSGNIYATGSFHETVDFDPDLGVNNLISNGKEDSFILKLDSNGDFLWAGAIGSTSDDIARSIAVDADGNTYITGLFEGSVDFDPGEGTFILSTGIIDHDIFIQKLNSNGDFLWAKDMGGPSNNDHGSSIAVDASANVYTTGGFLGTVDFDPGEGECNLSSYRDIDIDIFIQKLDTDGNFIWAKSIGGPSYDPVYSIAVDALENVYTTGCFSGSAEYNTPADFDPGPGYYNVFSNNDSRDIFIHKLDANGNFLWVRTMGGSYDEDEGLSIAIDSFANVYTTGKFERTVDFNPGTDIYNISSNGYVDIFIQKLDTDGNFLWALSMGENSEDVGRSIVVDPLANIYTNGGFLGTVDFDPGSGIFNLTFTDNDAPSLFVQKLSQCLVDLSLTKSGNTLVANATGASYQWIDCSAGNTAIAGETNQSFTATADGNYAVVINNGTCSDTSACYNITIVGINESGLNSSIEIYPNPTKGTITIAGEDIQNVEIRNVNGQLIRKITSKRKQFNIDLDDQAKGIYLINVITRKGVFVRKIVIE